MNTGRGTHSQQWDRTALHPQLPGGDLRCFELADGDDVCMYDEDEPEAYIIGVGVEVGTKR